MLIKFKVGDNFVYINPDLVFSVRKWSDETTIIQPGIEKCGIIVTEPLDRVAATLNVAMRR